MSKKISISNLSDEIQTELNKYAGSIIGDIKKLAEETTKELEENTKRDSPVRTGEYKKHISYKKTYESATAIRYTWYVKDPEYRLTHLIAKDHKKRNGGTVKGNNYLSKNVDLAEKNFIKGVEQIIQNGR